MRRPGGRLTSLVQQKITVKSQTNNRGDSLYGSSNYREIMDLILESLSGVVVTDVEGFIVYINKFYANILQVDPQEVIGKPARDIIPRTRMDIVAKTGKEEIGSVFMLKNGETIIVNRIPIKRDGKVIGVVAFSVLSFRNEVNTVSCSPLQASGGRAS